MSALFKNSGLATVYSPELSCQGFLINRGPQGVEAYDRDCASLGVFEDADRAAAAVHAKTKAAK